jgi:hypothetical protein
VSERLVAELETKPVGMAVVHSANATHHCEVYLVSMVLPNVIVFAVQRVTRQRLQDGYDVLIGMDIIATGDFAVSSNEGGTVFSFRHPSEECIDFLRRR